MPRKKRQQTTESPTQTTIPEQTSPSISILDDLNAILNADETELKKQEALIYNQDDAENKKPIYVFISSLVTATNKSEWTKKLNGSQINTLIEYLSNDDVLPDISLREVAKNSSEILKKEADALKYHILDDLEILANNPQADVQAKTLINPRLLQGLQKTIVADNKKVDFRQLEPGIYSDLYVKGYLKNMVDVEHIDPKLKNIVLTAFASIVVVDKNHKIHFIFPQLKTTISYEFKIYVQWLNELLKYSGLNKEDYDLTFACVHYKIVEDNNFQIDYIPFNTYSITSSPEISSLIWSADTLGDILANPDHKELDYLQESEIEELKVVLNEVRAANKNKTSYSTNLNRILGKDRFVLDDITITKEKRNRKIGATNGDVLGNNDLVLNDPVTNFDYKSYSTYDLIKYKENADFWKYESYTDKKLIQKLRNQVAKLSSDITKKQALTLINYDALLNLVDNYQTEQYASNLKNKEPEANDILFDDFSLMRTLYGSRADSDYAYSVYNYAHNVIPNDKKYQIYTYFKQANIKNKADLIKWLQNPNVITITPAYYDIIEKLKTLYLEPVKSSNKVLMQNTVYDNVQIDPDDFYTNFNNRLNNQPLVLYDFETISTFFNIVKGQVGKIQLPTQASIVCTDRNLNMINDDPELKSIDLVIDPITLNQDKDYKMIIDALYGRLKKLNAKGVVYNKSFEAHRLLEMLRYIDDPHNEYAAKVDYINQNTEDLMLFYARSNYSLSISDLKGKFSIKKLEPYPINHKFKTFNEYLNSKYHLLHYNTLAINRGDFAQLKTLQRLMNETNDEVWKTDSKELGIYCHNDVVNMIKQIANLKEIASICKTLFDEEENAYNTLNKPYDEITPEEKRDIRLKIMAKLNQIASESSALVTNNNAMGTENNTNKPAVLDIVDLNDITLEDNTNSVNDINNGIKKRRSLK